MAGDWIRMRNDLHDDPAVFKISSMTKLDRFAVVGRLFAFWAWADHHAVDGRVDGASSLVIDDVTRQDGFADALISVGWLKALDDAVEIPKHDRHNGESAKERGLKNARQARWRAGKTESRPPSTPAPTGPSTSPSTQASTREEKRREDKEISKLPLAPARPPAEPPQLTLVGTPEKPGEPPHCPHLKVLDLWAQALPAMPRHLPAQWKGARAEHLRTRWRETAVHERWTDETEGLTYLRRLFAYIGKSPFLTGRSKPRNDKPPFVIELEWLVLPSNWSKVIEGKYHQESA